MNNEEINYIPLCIFMILGLPRFYGFYNLSPIEWVNIRTNYSRNKLMSIRGIHNISILIAMISCFYILYYFMKNFPKEKEKEYMIYTGLLLFVGISSLWLPAVLIYKNYKYSILSIMILYFIGSLLLLSSVSMESNIDNEQIAFLVLCSYLCVHILFFDLIMWPGFF